jgi:hypothetical protein
MVILGVGAGVFTLVTTTQLENLTGKLFFATLTPMMGSVIASIIKVYLSGAAVGGRRLGILGILAALWQIGALPGETQKSLLLAGLQNSVGVVVVSSVISVSTVGGIQGVEAVIDGTGNFSEEPGGGGGGTPSATSTGP